jgi:hypothetical protein
MPTVSPYSSLVVDVPGEPVTTVQFEEVVQRNATDDKGRTGVFASWPYLVACAALV